MEYEMREVPLPRDYEGREIPLNTKVLYDLNGHAHDVQTFEFSAVDGMWRVSFLNGFTLFHTNDICLTPPDSWEKMLLDLGEALQQGWRSGNSVCAYLAARGLCRGHMSADGKCRLSDASICANGMVSNIRGRIKRLCAGDGE